MRRLCIALAAAGMLILAITYAGFVPAARLAAAVSSDGSLSPEFIARLRSSQALLGWLLLASPLFVLFFAQVQEPVFRLLRHATHRTFITIAAVLTFSLTLWLQEVMFDGIPHVTDATCHVFQARIFASGHWVAPLPPCPTAFHQTNMIMLRDGRWFSKYPPGQAALLAIGEIVHLRALVMPLLNALLVILAYSLSARITSTAVARTFGLLVATSPLLLLLGASYMSHTLALVFCLLAVRALVAACDRSGTSSQLFGFLAGASVGGLWLTRPPELAVLVLILAAALPALGWRTIPRLLGLLPGAALGFLIPFAAGAAWNHFLFGHYFAMGYSSQDPRLLTHVYHDQYGLGPAFTLRDALRLAFWSTVRLDKALTGWPSTFLVLPLLCFGAGSRRWVYICCAGIFINYAFYIPYNYYGMEFEARYYAVAALFLLLLVSFCLKNLYGLLRRKISLAAAPVMLSVLLIFSAHGVIHYWRDTLWPAYARDYEQAGVVLQKMTGRLTPARALVLISTSGPDGFRYSSGFVFNDPFLRSDVIFARDIPELYPCLMEKFPDRTILKFVASPDWQGGHFESLF